MLKKAEALNAAIAACLPMIRQEAKSTCGKWFPRNRQLIIADTVSLAYVIMRDGPQQRDQESGCSLIDYLRKTVRIAAGSVADRGQSRLIARLKRRPPEQKTDEVPDEEAIAERLQTQAEVRAALDGLGERMRQPLVMRYYDGMRSSEIAKVMGSTANAVNILLHRGREALASVLARHGESRSGRPGSRKRRRRRRRE